MEIPPSSGQHVQAVKSAVCFQREATKPQCLEEIIGCRLVQRSSKWNLTAGKGILEALWCWAKEVELNLYELLLTKNEEEETALHMAAHGNHVQILQNLCLGRRCAAVSK